MSAQDKPGTTSEDTGAKDPILKIEDLYVNFYTYDGIVRAIDGVYLQIEEGETYGLVGETGCGKSVTARAVLRLIPDPPGRITKGRVLYKGDDLLDGIESEAVIRERKHGAKIKRNKSLIKKNETWMQSIRGNGISMIFQEPMSALNPVFTIGDQLAEVFLLHRRKELLDIVFKAWTPEGVKEELESFVRSSNELNKRINAVKMISRHRINLEMKDSAKPKQVVELLDKAIKGLDPSNKFVKGIAHIENKRGRVVVTLNDTSTWTVERARKELEEIIRSSKELADKIKEIEVKPDRYLFVEVEKKKSRAKVYHEINSLMRSASHYNIFIRQIAYTYVDGKSVVVVLRKVNPIVRRSYKKLHGLEGTKAEMRGFKAAMRREVQRIKRELKGKASDEELAHAGGGVYEVCDLAKKQDIVIGDALSLSETVRSYDNRIFRAEIPELISRRWFKTLHRYMLSQMTTTALGESHKMLKLVNVPHPDRILEMYPFELSGGMQQRAMIAMALSCNPMLLIADEPSTALDVTIQAQILELMKALKRNIGTSIMLITHDLGVVAEMCLRVGVMYGGAIVEEGRAEEIFYEQKHPYTMGLISSIPTMEKKSERLSIIPGSVPNLINPPSGCRFHPRCPHAMEGCTKHKPPDTYVTKTHRVACFLYGEGLPVDERTHLKTAAEEKEMEVKAQ